MHSSRPNSLNERLSWRRNSEVRADIQEPVFLVLLSHLGEDILDLDLKSTDQSVPKLTKPSETCLGNTAVSCGHREGASHPRTEPAKVLFYEL